MEKFTTEPFPSATQTAYIFKMICENGDVGGSFRNLIYNKLGYNLVDYDLLYNNRGMEITNKMNNEWWNKDNYGGREMRWLPLNKREEIEGMRNIPPFAEVSCQACGVRWIYFTDIEEGKYSALCNHCGHVIRVFISRKKHE